MENLPNQPKLSYMQVPRHDDPATIACRMRQAVKPGVVVTSRCGIWSLCLSHDLGVTGCWIFSAKCVTAGSVLEDWRLLGMLAITMGAPLTEVPQSIEKDPNATHRWFWTDGKDGPVPFRGPGAGAVPVATGTPATFH